MGQIRPQLEKEIGKIIYYDTEISFQNTPAYLIGVQIGDSSYVFPYGTVSQKSGLPPASDDLFEIGGLTKSFSALLTGILAQSGQIHPDSSVNSYLPAQFRNPAAAHITVLDLVQHTSDLPRLPDAFGLKEKDPANPFGHYTKTDLLEYFAQANIVNHKKKKYHYSHTNYALLEVVLELVTDQSYESLLQEFIFQPFQMTQSGIKDLTVTNRNKIVQGHSLGGQPTPTWNMQSFAASEGIKSSMNDLLRYLKISMKANDNRLSPILTQNQQALVKTDLTKNTYGGNGWHVIKNKSYYNVILHAGSTTGYRSFLGFVPETQTGVIILANSPKSMNGLGLLILRMINNNWKRKKRSFKTKKKGL